MTTTYKRVTFRICSMVDPRVRSTLPFRVFIHRQHCLYQNGTLAKLKCHFRMFTGLKKRVETAQNARELRDPRDLCDFRRGWR